jgi:hypothetical protein
MAGRLFFAAPSGGLAGGAFGVAFASEMAGRFLSVSLDSVCAGGSSSGVNASFDGFFRSGFPEVPASAAWAGF